MRVWSVVFAILLLYGCRDTSNPEYSLLNQKAQDSYKLPDSSIYYATESLKSYTDPDNLYYSHQLLAYAFTRKSQYDKAVFHYLESINHIPKEEKYHPVISSLYKNLARLNKLAQNWDEAEKLNQIALDYASDDQKASILINLGNVYLASSREDEAVQKYLEGLDAAKENNQVNKQAKAYNWIGIALNRAGKYNEAREYLFEIINAIDNPEYNRYAGRAYHNIGFGLYKQNLPDSAIDFYKQSLSIKEKESDKFITYMDLGEAYHSTNRYDSSYKYYLLAESLYDNVPRDYASVELFHKMEILFRDMKLADLRDEYDIRHQEENKIYNQYRETLSSESQAAAIDSLIRNYYELQIREMRNEKIIQWSGLIVFSLALIGILFVYINGMREKRKVAAVKEAYRHVPKVNQYLN